MRDNNSAEVDGDTDRGANVSRRFDQESLLEDLIYLIADATNREPLEMPPLAENIDPDALVDLVGSRSDAHTVVRFRFNECDVTVDSCGEMTATAIGE